MTCVVPGIEVSCFWGRETLTLLGPLERANLNHSSLSKGPNRVGVSLPSPEDGNRSSFLNVVFLLSYLEVRAMNKVHKPSDSECYTPSSESFRIELVGRDISSHNAFTQNGQYKHRINVERRSCHERDSIPWSKDASCLRPRNHCDRLLAILKEKYLRNTYEIHFWFI
jgi:hypothetical protein